MYPTLGRQQLVASFGKTLFEKIRMETLSSTRAIRWPRPFENAASASSKTITRNATDGSFEI
jgi:hypothetical protein